MNGTMKYALFLQLIAFGFDIIMMLNPFFDVVDEFGVIIATIIIFTKINKRYKGLKSGIAALK
jgi:hypothetical protein